MTTSAELRDDLSRIVASTRELLNLAKSENRDLSDEENNSFTTNREQIATIERQIDSAEKEETVAHYEAKVKSSQGRRTAPAEVGKGFNRQLSGREVNEFYRSWTLAATDHANPTRLHEAAEYGFNFGGRAINVRALYRGMSGQRALGKASNGAGGYDVPQSDVFPLDIALKYYFPIEEAFDTFDTEDGRDYPAPTVDDTANSASIVSEAGGITSATDPTFGQVVYKSWDYYSPIVKVASHNCCGTLRPISPLC
jgi:HK97 family phage major capsid protein